MNLTADSPYIRVADVTLCRGGKTLFEGLSFDLGPGDRLAVMGGSGTGKSSLLQALLGRANWGDEAGRGGRLPGITQGAIHIGGIPHSQRRDWVGWLAANAGVLFQSGALFEGRSVADNLAFPFKHAPVRRLGLPRRPDAEQLAELLHQVGLLSQDASPAKRDEMLRKPVTNLSGGQRKRLALARAIALQPRLLLLDEPTSGLDTDNAAAVADTIRSLSERDGVAVLCITHDPVFVERLGCNKRIEIGVETNNMQAPGAEYPRKSVLLDAGVQPRPWGDTVVMVGQQALVRLGRLLVDGVSLCIPVALIAGAGLVIQAVAGPRLIQAFLAQGVVVGVFLGMGTIIPALLVIGLSASGLTGELAQRKHDNQLEYLRLLQIPPVLYLGVPIGLSLLLAVPALIWASEFLMLVGGAVALKAFEARSAVTSALFWDQVWRLVTPEMWYRSAIKGITHGALIGVVACSCGFMSGPGEHGLRRAIFWCVLLSSLAIILGDVLWSWHWAGQW